MQLPCYDVWAANEVVNLIAEVSEPLDGIKNIKCTFLVLLQILNNLLSL